MSSEEMDDFDGLFKEEEEEDAFSDYGSAQYWDSRYRDSRNPFDWYFGWDKLAEKIGQFVKPSDSALVIGCGNAEMSFDMLKEGFPRIVNIDISPSVIEQMKEKYAGEKRLEWMVMDCADLSAFRDGEFDLVIDKGTFDAIMCGQGSDDIIDRAMKENYRVLKNGGHFIIVTFGSPSQRFPAMRRTRLPWYVYPPIIMMPQNQGIETSRDYIYIFEKREAMKE